MLRNAHQWDEFVFDGRRCDHSILAHMRLKVKPAKALKNLAILVDNELPIMSSRIETLIGRSHNTAATWSRNIVGLKHLHACEEELILPLHSSKNQKPTYRSHRKPFLNKTLQTVKQLFNHPLLTQKAKFLKPFEPMTFECSKRCSKRGVNHLNTLSPQHKLIWI